MNRALFLDLDGTVIKTKSGNDFPKDYDDWEFINGMLPLIRSYSDKGYIIILVSNQGGIEAGHVDPVKFEQKFDRIRNEIADYIGCGVSGFYCPFIAKDNYYRKPNPGMIYRAAVELELNLFESIMIGDMESDAKTAKNAHIGTFWYVDSFIKYNNV